MFFHYLTLSFIVYNSTSNTIKNITVSSFEFQGLFREINIQFDYKLQDTCSGTLIRTVFLKNIKAEILEVYYIRVYQHVNSTKNEKTVFLF